MIKDKVLEENVKVCDLIKREQNISLIFIEMLFKANKITEEQYEYIQKKYGKQ